MKINRLASAISRGKWLVEPRTYMTERARAVNFLTRVAEVEQVEEVEIEPAYILTSDYNRVEINDWTGEFEGLGLTGNICIIPICGTIMKYDYCGSPGTDTLSYWLKMAVASPQIDAIVLLINSGGGSVEGTGEFADLVKALSEEKTIHTFCDGLMASAAYWIGCSSPEVWVSHATCEIGSIGTAVSFMDDTKYMEEMGFTEVYINADSSPDKNQDVIQAIAGDDKGLKDNIINPTNEIFMAAVKANRNGKLKLSGKGEYKEPLTGKVYLAEAAIENGLIDGVCTLEECIEKALLNSKNMPTKEEKEKLAKKNLSFKDRLMSFLTAEKDDYEMTDEEKEAKKKADEEEEAKKEKAAKKAAIIAAGTKKNGKTPKSKDDEDYDDDKNYDPDDDNDDDSDEEDIEVNGRTIRVNKAAKAAIAELTEKANKEIADRDALLTEANTLLAENTETLKKSDEEIRRSIKSSFTIKGSQRSARIAVQGKPDTVLDALIPKEGSAAEKYLNQAVLKAKRK